MKTNFKRFLTSIIVSSSLLVSCNNNDETPSDNVLRIATCEQNIENSAYFLKQYAKDNPDIKFEISVYECDSLKYRSHHGKIDADILLLDDLSSVNKIGDQLIDFASSEELASYSRYVKNFLKNNDGRVYCLPSPGSWYCYCLNLDLIEKYNMTIPNTISDLIDFSNEIKDYVTPFVSTFGDDRYYLDAFMQTCIPSFFATAKGGYTFDNLVSGREKIADSKYCSDFSDTLLNLYKLTSASFFDNKITKEEGVAKFFNSEAAILSVSPSFDFNAYYSDYNASFNYTFLPLMGRKTNNDWVCSISDSYLTVPKNAYSGAKKKLIDNFVKFFASATGQDYLLKDEEGVNKQNHFSFVNNNLIPTSTNANKSLVNAISEGRVFLIDKFYPSFSSTVDSFKQYAEDKIDAASIIDSIDYYNELILTSNVRYYEIQSLKDVEDETKNNMLEILRYVSNGIKSQMNLDALILEEDFLLQPIYNGLIYEHELNMVFNDSSYCSLVKANGRTLKEILDYCEERNEEAISETSEKDGNMKRYFSSLGNVTLDFIKFEQLKDATYYLSGVSISSEGENKKYLLGNKMEIDDNREYYFAVPVSFVNEGEFDLTTIGSQFSCLETYKMHLENNRL